MKKPISILVVDDETFFAEWLAENLQEAPNHYNAHWVDSGERALEFIRGQPVDLVVSDIKMAGSSGLELLKVIRANHPGVGVILMTGYALPELQQEAVKRGSLFYLEKPFPMEKLESAIEQTLQMSVVTTESSVAPPLPILDLGWPMLDSGTTDEQSEIQNLKPEITSDEPEPPAQVEAPPLPILDLGWPMLDSGTTDEQSEIQNLKSEITSDEPALPAQVEAPPLPILDLGWPMLDSGEGATPALGEGATVPARPPSAVSASQSSEVSEGLPPEGPQDAKATDGQEHLYLLQVLGASEHLEGGALIQLDTPGQATLVASTLPPASLTPTRLADLGLYAQLGHRLSGGLGRG
jgi:CheY-like chemotaxis protein